MRQNKAEVLSELWTIYSFKPGALRPLKHTAATRGEDYIRHGCASCPFHADSEDKGEQQSRSGEFNMTAAPRWCSRNGHVEQLRSGKGGPSIPIQNQPFTQRTGE